jgi:ribosomal protein S18 acetylase RimI-like enzyme
VLDAAQGLTPAALAAIETLAERTVDHDCGRLKLEWATLRSRPADQVNDLLWWDDDGKLLGFLGLYSFSDRAVELAGMVDPVARRRGIGSALLAAALERVRQRAYPSILLVAAGGTPGGREFAAHHGGRLDHSEHAMVLTGDPAQSPPQTDVTVRPAVRNDVDAVARLLEQGFGWSPPPDLLASIGAASGHDDDRSLIIEEGGHAVGTVRLTRDGDRGGVYGFVVDPSRQGRGIGRYALGQFCAQLRAEGCTQIGLEVSVDNDHALGLYESVGFRRVATEDYYALPTA